MPQEPVQICAVRRDDDEERPRCDGGSVGHLAEAELCVCDDGVRYPKGTRRDERRAGHEACVELLCSVEVRLRADAFDEEGEGCRRGRKGDERTRSMTGRTNRLERPRTQKRVLPTAAAVAAATYNLMIEVRVPALQESKRLTRKTPYFKLIVVRCQASRHGFQTHVLRRRPYAHGRAQTRGP